MTELKTLKDLRTYMWNDDEYENMDISNVEYSEGKEANLLRDDAVTLFDLRQNAIKWIKELEPIGGYIENYCLTCQVDMSSRDNENFYERYDRNKVHDDHIILHNEIEESDISGVTTFLKHFFNITEEDLK